MVKNAKFSWASPPGPHLGAYGDPLNPQAVVNSLRYLPGAPLVLLILEIRHVLLFIRRSQCCRPEPLKSRKFLLLARESLKRFFKLYQTVFTCIVSPPVIFLRLRMLKLLYHSRANMTVFVFSVLYVICLFTIKITKTNP